MTKTKNWKTIMAGILSAAMLLTSMTACKKDEDADDKDGKAKTEAIAEADADILPVQLMTRESQTWSNHFAGETVEIKGDGTYSATVEVTGNYTIFPNIALNAVGTNTEDTVTSAAVKASDKYINSTVTIDSFTVNGKEIALKDNTDVMLVADAEKMAGYANVQLWNAWWEPGQRIDVDNSESVDRDGSGYLQFDEAVTSMEITFTVSDYGSTTPIPKDDDSTSDEEEEEEPAEDEPILDPPEVTITGDFNAELTAEQLVGEIGVGWNLGNTFDAYNSGDPGEPFDWVDYDDMTAVETAWIQMENATTYNLIKRVKDSGFNAIRIPVTWYKMAGEAPDYTIREEWLSHIQKVVDMAVAEDMYIILNTHHDEYIMRFEEDAAVGEQAVKALWTQIGERFADYDEKLIFEGLNEPRARNNDWNTQGSWDWSGDEDKYITLNRWNQAFVNAVRETGGNNEKRHLMLATYGAQSYEGPTGGFELPSDPVAGNGTSRFIWSIHVYSPHNWAHDGNGSYGGEEFVRADIERVADRAAELGIPVIFGEWGSVSGLKKEERIQHAYDYISIATSMRERDENPVTMACIWWDDSGNFGLINRKGKVTATGKDIINAITRAREGLPLA